MKPQTQPKASAMTQQERDRMILDSAPTDQPLNDIEEAALDRERNREEADDVTRHSGDGGEGISDFYRSLESRDERANARADRRPCNFAKGTKVRDIYTGKINTVSCSYWQWYAGGNTSDYTVEFEGGGWNKSTNLEVVKPFIVNGRLVLASSYEQAARIQQPVNLGGALCGKAGNSSSLGETKDGSDKFHALPAQNQPGGLSPEIDEAERNRREDEKERIEKEWYENERSRAATADYEFEIEEDFE